MTAWWRRQGQAGEVTEEEIEVTPEMEDAGMAVIWAWDDRFESACEVARRVYSAMEKARRGVCAQAVAADASNSAPSAPQAGPAEAGDMAGGTR